MHRSTLIRLLATALGAVIVLAVAGFSIDSTTLVLIACTIYISLAAGLYKLDYLHPSIAYVLPWSMILVFSVIPISIHARPMDVSTYELLLATMFAWLFGCVSAEPGGKPAAAMQSQASDEFRPAFRKVVIGGFIFLYLFAAMNIALAGYIPVVSLLTTGDSRYLEFGVPSVYGAFLAYSNALGCVAFYVYLRTKKRINLLFFLSVLVMHIAFITRQNIVTLIVEVFVIRCLSVKRVTGPRVLLYGALALSAFSLLGTLRSGDAKELFGVQPDYAWVPTSIVWFYAYSYFNALNIDNLLTHSGAPFFDGFMWHSLLPTVLRPESNHETLIEVSSAAASSYIYPVYTDIGSGVVPWTAFLSLITAAAYRKALQFRRFVDIATYSCLFFCAMLSFFVDFWLYLPVIFQIFFFRVFHILLFKRSPRRTLVTRLQ